MLFRAPKSPDFDRVARFGTGYPQKSVKNLGTIFTELPDLYPQKSLILALLKNFWQKSGNASFCDLPTKTNKMSSVYNLGYL